jgi:4a-hydroxytetrahydrobiopterin dehydratase
MEPLSQRQCQPCTGETPALARAEIEHYLRELPGWALSDEGDAIEYRLKTPNFLAALELFRRLGAIAEAQGHHPDLHLTDYHRVRIVLSTHAIGGLSENDFILAARISEALRSS